MMLGDYCSHRLMSQIVKRSEEKVKMALVEEAGEMLVD